MNTAVAIFMGENISAEQVSVRLGFCTAGGQYFRIAENQWLRDTRSILNQRLTK